jgi:hypothetical protein
MIPVAQRDDPSRSQVRAPVRSQGTIGLTAPAYCSDAIQRSIFASRSTSGRLPELRT